MHCLLCHEKIPRLRVWRTKSEFCCEEHAALYKKQTLERLLVDPTANQNGVQSSLPEPPEPEEFELDEVEVRAAQAQQPSGEGAHDDFQFWERFDRSAQAKTESVELPPPVNEHEEQGIDELWRLADEVEHDGRGGSVATSGVNRQSAEEALEALRQLANRAAGTGAKPPAKPKVYEMPGLSDLRRDDSLHHRNDFDEQEPALDEAVPAETEPSSWETPMAEAGAPPNGAGRSYLGEEPEDDSILERLMADPLQSWKQDKAGPDIRGIDEAGEADAPGLDLDAPEPAWDFEDVSSELNALKASLAGSGSPPVAYEQHNEHAEEVDFSPAEPDWDELEALDLTDADIEPPEPQLEDAAPAADAAKILAFPQPPNPGEQPEHEHEPAAAVRETAARSASPRFRPVLELVEIEPDFAEAGAAEASPVETEASLLASDPDAQRYSMPGGPAAIGPRTNGIRGRDAVLAADAAAACQTSLATPRELRQADEIAPPRGQLFLPTATGAAFGQACDLSMHDGSVDIEPTAMLDAPEPTVFLTEGADRPFEPAGLFFDMTPGGASASGEAEEQGVGVAGAAAGPPRESR